MKRHFLFPLMVFACLPLFLIDMKHESGSAIYQLYGFAHLAFFMLMAWGLSRLPDLAERPFLFQFFIIMSVVLLAGGIIELIQSYFGRTARWRDLGIDLQGAFIGVVFLVPTRRALRRGVLVFGQIAAAGIAVIVFYGPVVTL